MYLQNLGLDQEWDSLLLGGTCLMPEYVSEVMNEAL